MPAPKEIQELVEKFERNREAYTSSRFNETQLRIEFLNPFFTALGWDMDNKKGRSEAYREVVHEDAIKVGDTIKAPDYSFRAGGQRKFFLEAKKPSVNIESDPGPAFQLRRYAWSAGKLPLSILSDFEEFAVYDTRVKPKEGDKASTARILFFKYTDYLEKWDEIAGLFSLDAVLGGNFDKFAEGGKGRKGTVTVDQDFLQQIEGWRELLAKNLALRNDTLTVESLNYAVQKIIDRIIFLRICEGRGIETVYRLQGAANGENVYARLRELFREADDKYNSGIFHFKPNKEQKEPPDTFTLDLDIDNKVLKEIISDLYPPKSPYEFGVLPVEILGQVYEQFLGKVIRLTAGHQAKVEEKPEVRKAGGVYYTPQYIVDYIVKNTVGKLLEGKTPKTTAALKILDPACGSGSFLLGAYRHLIDWHRDWYVKDGPENYAKGKNPAVFLGPGNLWRLTSGEKKRILLNNIHGVDIDAQAVEVTKLSLLLQVLEGESELTLRSQLSLFKERALPDLGGNIKCGNSLIGYDILGKQLTETEEFVNIINPFDWDKGFPEIFSPKIPKEKQGFDVVIGNPPYVMLETNVQKDILIDNYEFHLGKPDLYRFFIERSLHVTRKEGLFSFIIPNTILTIPAGVKLREYLLNDGGLIKILNFKGMVFDRVSVNSIIIVCSKQTAAKSIEVFVDESKAPNWISVSAAAANPLILEKKTLKQDPQLQINLTVDKGADLIINKIRDSSVELIEVAKFTLGMQVYHNTMHSKSDIENRVYHSENKKNKTFFSESGGRNIQRYHFIRKFKEFVSYGEWCYNKPDWEYCSEPRILIREIPSSTLVCAYTDTAHVSNKAVILVIPNNIDIFSLLGVLNSRLIGFYVKAIGEKGNQTLFPRITLTTTRKLPIGIKVLNGPKKKLLEEISDLSKQMNNLNDRRESISESGSLERLQRQIDATDRQIDALVYELYGLTDEEIKIVESS